MTVFSECGGKLWRRPALDRYDNMPPDASPLSQHLQNYPSTHDRDKALLVALGVDGDVPLAQAMVNAGLAPIVRLADLDILSAALGWPANDNHTQAAAAA